MASFATLDLKTKIVTYKCELCGDEYYDTNPDLGEDSLDKCEVCWADSNETIIHHYQGSIYCEQDLERAKVEGWHSV